MRQNRLRRWLHDVWERILDNKSQAKRIARVVRALPQLEQLEDRLTPAVLSDNGAGILAIALGVNEHLNIVANASTYTFSSNQTFTDGGVSNPEDFSGFGGASFTLQASGIARYGTLINITDTSGASANTTVTFDDSGTNNYANNFTIALNNAGAGQITFNGSSNFGTSSLQAGTAGSIVVSSGAAVSSSTGSLTLSSTGTNTALNINGSVVSQNGVVTLQATGDVTVAVNQTISSGSGALTLGADLTAAGAGNDGIGTLSINAGASVYGANITLQGADENIDSTATVGSAGGTTTFVDPSAGLLLQPFAEAFDSSGNLYIVSSINATVYKVTPAGVVSTLVNSGLSAPYGLAIDSSGDLYVSDPNYGSITEFDSQGNFLNSFGSVGPGRPFDIAIDSSGNLYVADFDGSEVSKYAPDGTPINADYIVEPSGSGPTGLAIDSLGNLYVANAYTGTVSQYDSSGNLINASFYSGSPGVHDLTIDSADNLYITNQGTNQVIKVTPAGVASIDVNTGLNGPTGIAIDSGGDVYVANYGGNSVTMTLPITTQVSIRSSVESRPMQIGGSNNSAVAGINLTSAELARIFTTSALTVGDSSQTGTIVFTSAIPATTVTSAGTIQVDGSLAAGSAVTVEDGGTLDGPGTVNGSVTVQSGGALAPGHPGILTTGDLSLDSGATLDVQLNGTTAGTLYDQVDATGSVNLDADSDQGATLNVSLGYAPAIGDHFTIINNNGNDPVAGTFDGLPQGGILAADYNGTTYYFSIDYAGDESNDVVLTAVDRTVIVTGAAPDDELVQPTVGEAFTVLVGSFVPAFPATANDFTATIDWGDNTASEGVITPNSDGSFNVTGTHIYTTEATYLVSFSVTDTATGEMHDADAGYAVAFTDDQTVTLQNADFASIPAGGGSVTAATANVSGTLTLPAGTTTPGTISVVQFQNSPAVPPVPQLVIDSAFPQGTTVKSNFYDVRVTGAVPAATLVVTFHYDSTGITNPVVVFYDPTTGISQVVHGSTRIANSFVVDPVQHTIRIVFDSTSFPLLGNLHKTVFTVAVAAPTTPVSTTLTPATALAATQGTTTDSPSSSGVTVSFQTSSKMTVSVNAVQDSARAPSSGSANDKQDDDDSDDTTDGVDPQKKKGDKTKKHDDKSKKQDKKKQDKKKHVGDKANPPATQEIKPAVKDPTPDVTNEVKPSEKPMPDGLDGEPKLEAMEELNPESLDAYFAWSAAALGFAATPLTARPQSRRRSKELVS